MKKVGIVGWRVGDNSFGSTTTYLEFAQEFGKPRILMPQDEVEDVDIVILPGGLDVNPNSYGKFPQFSTSSTDVFKQYFLDTKLQSYIDRGIPVFGICLGFQQLNIHFGGSLVQHLKNHEQSPARGEKAHDVFFNQLAVHGLLGDNYGKKQEVNSHHHQAVTLDTLAPFLLPLATTKNKEFRTAHTDIVESFIHANDKVAGVQWHPEEWQDDFSRDLFNHLLNS